MLQKWNFLIYSAASPQYWYSASTTGYGSNVDLNRWLKLDHRSPCFHFSIASRLTLEKNKGFQSGKMSESMRASICRILHCSMIEHITRILKKPKSLSVRARIYRILAWHICAEGWKVLELAQIGGVWLLWKIGPYSCEKLPLIFIKKSPYKSLRGYA